MSKVLEHARTHYFKGAYALSLFGDLSAIGGVPIYDAYGIQVPKPDTLILPFTLSSEREGMLMRSIPHLQRGLSLEANQEEGERQLILRSSGFLKVRRHLSLKQEGEKLKITLLSEKEEPLLDTLLRETVLGEALSEHWVNSGFFKRRNLEDFDKELVVEAALEQPRESGPRRQITSEEAAKELEKARKLLLEITPKSLTKQTDRKP